MSQENPLIPERNTHLELKLHRVSDEGDPLALAHRRACCELRLEKFRTAIEEAISRYSIDDVTNTPRHILADYLLAQTRVLSTHTYLRDGWYGEDSAIRPLQEETHHDLSLYPRCPRPDRPSSARECAV